jgi:hypothetical protein
MAETVRRVRPTPFDGYIANPHRGCCTFQHFNGDELFPGTKWSEEGPVKFPPRKYSDVTPGYLPTTVSYCRWFWEVVEPEEGKFDFSVIDKSIETAKERGQTLAIRLMPFGSYGQPQLPKWYGKKYPVQPWKFGNGKTLQVPDYESAEYIQKFGGLIIECGKRYDGHPMIETIDVGYIGPWGEGDGEMSVKQMRAMNVAHKKGFSKTARLIEMGGEGQAKVGIAAGAGWRWNCYGDMGNTGSPQILKTNSWNHMFDVYAEAVIKSGGADRWKTQPIHFESGWVPMGWYEKDWDIDFILQQGLKFHVTYFMPKYTKLPEAWMDKLADFSNKIGYRYVYRQAKYDTPVKAGTSFKFHSWIENVGVAPIYRRYDFALRLRQGDHEEIIPIRGVDIRKWLPGDAIIDTTVKLPSSIKPGWAELSAGLLDPQTREARVCFAAKEVYSDRWVGLGGIEVLP